MGQYMQLCAYVGVYAYLRVCVYVYMRVCVCACVCQYHKVRVKNFVFMSCALDSNSLCLNAAMKA